MPEMKINTANYPYLEGLMKKDPQKAREVMMTFIKLMDEAVENEWHLQPELFSKELTFGDLVKGVLHGALDLPKMNPDAYDAIKEEVHPLSMLSIRKDHLNGGIRLYNWRQHFRLPSSTEVNQETVETIIRKLLRYAKYVDVESFGKAMINDQIATFRSMDQAKNLPFYPALRYQQKHLGDLHVGMFFDDVGAFDCGNAPIAEDPTICPACGGKEEAWEIHDKLICPRCNAGFKKPK